MLIEHEGRRPQVHETAYIAPTAVVCSDVTIAPRSHVAFGAIVVVHVNTILEAGTTVPIGWIAVGSPGQCFPPSEHEQIWAIQKPLNFPKTVYGVDRNADGSVDMRAIMRTVAQRYDAHRTDRILD